MRLCRPGNSSGVKPSLTKSSSTRERSRMRSTTLSPKAVGIVDMRKSMSMPRTAILIRPSWGSRRSAMSSLAMILRRDVIAARTSVARVRTVRSAPSMR